MIVDHRRRIPCVRVWNVPGTYPGVVSVDSRDLHHAHQDAGHIFTITVPLFAHIRPRMRYQAAHTFFKSDITDVILDPVVYLSDRLLLSFTSDLQTVHNRDQIRGRFGLFEILYKSGVPVIEIVEAGQYLPRSAGIGVRFYSDEYMRSKIP